jgi:hypothetical protein
MPDGSNIHSFSCARWPNTSTCACPTEHAGTALSVAPPCSNNVPRGRISAARCEGWPAAGHIHLSIDSTPVKSRKGACEGIPRRAIFAFKAASILRRVFFVIIRSVYQTKRPISNLAPGPQNQRGATIRMTISFWRRHGPSGTTGFFDRGLSTIAVDDRTWLSARNGCRTPAKVRAERPTRI